MRTEWREVFLLEAKVTVEGRVIRNVALLGAESPSRRRTYSEAARREAVPLYANVPVYQNHPPEGKEHQIRDVEDLVGHVQNPRFDEVDRIPRGDIHILEGTDGDRILAIARTQPHTIGASHNALGGEREDPAKPGHTIVESIVLVRSLDLVTDASTAPSGLLESEARDGKPSRNTETTMDWKDVTYATLQENRSEIFTRIRKEGVDSVQAELKESKDALTESEGKLEAATKRGNQLQGVNALESQMRDCKLPKAAKERVTNSITTLIEAGHNVTAKMVESAITETAALLESCGAKAGEGDGGGDGKPADSSARLTAILENTGGFPPMGDDGKKTKDEATAVLVESVATMGDLVGCERPVEKKD